MFSKFFKGDTGVPRVSPEDQEDLGQLREKGDLTVGTLNEVGGWGV